MDFKEIEIIVSKCKEGDDASKEKLANEFRPFIINISKKTFVHGYSEEDIRSECYRILFHSVQLYKCESHRFVAYATNALKNTIHALIKQNLRRDALEGAASLTFTDKLSETLPSSDPSLDDILCHKFSSLAFNEILEDLTPNEKELLNYIYIEKNSLASYSTYKNISYAVARKILKKLLCKLRHKLEEKHIYSLK